MACGGSTRLAHLKRSLRSPDSGFDLESRFQCFALTGDVRDGVWNWTAERGRGTGAAASRGGGGGFTTGIYYYSNSSFLSFLVPGWVCFAIAWIGVEYIGCAETATTTIKCRVRLGVWDLGVKATQDEHASLPLVLMKQVCP